MPKILYLILFFLTALQSPVFAIPENPGSQFLYETLDGRFQVLVNTKARKTFVLFPRHLKAVELQTEKFHSANLALDLSYASINLKDGGYLIISPLLNDRGLLQLTRKDEFIPLKRSLLSLEDADIADYPVEKMTVSKLRSSLNPRNFKELIKLRKIKIHDSFVSANGNFIVVGATSAIDSSTEIFLIYHGNVFSIPLPSLDLLNGPKLRATTEKTIKKLKQKKETQILEIDLNSISIVPLRLDAMKWSGISLSMEDLRALILHDFPIWYLIDACKH